MTKKSTRPILLVGASVGSPDLEYASGFHAPDPVVFLRNKGRRHLVVPELEYGRACRAAARQQVHTPTSLGLRGEKRRRLGEWALALLRSTAARTVSVPPTFPHAVAMRLQRGGISVHVAREPLFPERAVKSVAEIKKIKESQQAAVIAMRAAVGLIAKSRPHRDGSLCVGREPLTSAMVRRRIAGILLDHNCIARDIIVAGGRQAADPHEQGTGPLREAEAIVIDIFPQHQEHGYWGDLTRTVVKGHPSLPLRRMYQAVKAAQAAALDRVKAGVHCATVHGAACQEFERRGFQTTVCDGAYTGFIHSTGHGVGLAIHEAPSIGLRDTRLRSGNVITIEPGLYYPDVGAVRIEDTIVVTPHGWQYLVPCEKRFET